MPKLLTGPQIQKRFATLTGWKRDKRVISRTYTFSGFVPAMAFVNHVASLAEGMDHHPDIRIDFKKVTLTLSTHSAGGLTELDFRLAAKIDA